MSTILQEIEHQLTIISGQLALVHTEEDSVFLKLAQAEIAGLIHGIRNIVEHVPEKELALDWTNFEQQIARMEARNNEHS